jgi:hypothetical protein
MTHKDATIGDRVFVLVSTRVAEREATTHVGTYPDLASANAEKARYDYSNFHCSIYESVVGDDAELSRKVD